MNKFSFPVTVLGVGAILFFASGCASASVENKEEKSKKADEIQYITERNIAAARKTAEDFVNAFAAAMKSGDYMKLSEKTREKITKQRFDQMISVISERRGKLTAHTFAADLDQTIVRDFLWKFSFLKTPAEAGKKAIRTEVIYLVRVAMMNNAPVVIGFGFSR